MQSSLGRWNKENSSGSPSKQLQRLRVELSDKTFQLHKLEQDYAQEKAHSSAQIQRERAHLLKQLKELKQKNAFDNEQWSNKIAQQRKQHSKELQKLEQNYAQNLITARLEIRHNVQKEYEKTVANLKVEITQLKQSYQLSITGERRKRIKEISQIQLKWQSLLQKQKKQDSGIYESMKKQLQEKVNVLQRLYLSEEKSKQNLAQEIQKNLQYSVKEKLTFEGLISNEKSTVTELNSKLALAQHQIKQLNHNIIKKEEQFQRIIADIQKNHFSKLEEAQHQFKQALKAERSTFIRQSQLLHIQFNRFRELQEQKQRKWQQRGESILNTLQKQGGEKGDDAAKLLQIQLRRKQGQLQHQKQALRLCRLELENMAEVYDKVFLANNYLNRQRGKSFKIQQKTQLCHSGVLQPLRARLRTHGDQ